MRLSFARPTNRLEFGLALATFGSFEQGALVALYNPGGHLRKVVPVPTASSLSFTEGRFAYRGGAIGSAVITFDPTVTFAFAIDNLLFEQKGVPAGRPVRQARLGPGHGRLDAGSRRVAGGSAARRVRGLGHRAVERGVVAAAQLLAARDERGDRAGRLGTGDGDAALQAQQVELDRVGLQRGRRRGRARRGDRELGEQRRELGVVVGRAARRRRRGPAGGPRRGA